MEMPLFPLNVVLFPGMALPLHIFEPRYREMINRCLDENLAFGVVLIKEGLEVGGDGLLPSGGDDDDLFDSGFGGLFHDVLQHGPVEDGQ